MASGTDVVTIAAGEIGKPYVYGGGGPNTFDCSGLVAYSYGLLGISLPHNAAQQQKTATPVGMPQPGDLVFFGDPAYHVGIYAGNGQMISAPHAGALVHLTPVGNPTGYGRVNGVGGISGALDSLQNKATSLLDPTKIVDTVKTSTFVLFGVALLGVGLWQAFKGGPR